MATRPGGRSSWEVGPGEPRLQPPKSQGGPGSPAVLSLSHFCRSPFLCFGELRPGASRTLPLTLHNPNDEVAEVKVWRFPAAERGFSISQRLVVLQPKEKTVISVNWTPLEEGRVREIITFLVNDVLKHQAILLGSAEEKKKKKRSLWDTVSKKKVSVSSSRNKITSSSSSHNKRNSNTHSINETFDVSQQAGRVRSPLKACENLAVSESSSPAENNFLVSEENKIALSPISPSFKNCHGDTHLCLSAQPDDTFTSLREPENKEHLEAEDANILKDFSFGVKTVSETSFNSINNINNLTEGGDKQTLIPTCSSTLNIVQSQGQFLSPDSFVNNIHRANSDLDVITCLSSETFMKDNSRPGHLESNTVHLVYRTILSPDSFIKDSCGLNLDLEPEPVPPILSPNQFLRDNMEYLRLSPQTCTFSPVSNENSQAIQPLLDLRKSDVLPCILECQDPESPKMMLKESKATEWRSECRRSTKQKQPKLFAVQDISSHSHDKQLKRRPILSSTVTKKKPVSAGESQTDTNKPKAKRCLGGAVEELNTAGDNQEKDAFHLILPVIDPLLSQSRSHKNEIPPPPEATSVVRKRKSEGSLENATVRAAMTGHTAGQKPKRIHFSPPPLQTSTVKKAKRVTTPLSKRVSSREKFSGKKKTDPSVYRTPHSQTRRTKPVIAVAQSTLTFIKPLKAAIPRHPMPFAAKNMFYDERWKEKQEQGFTWWLNFILTPDDFSVKTSTPEVNATTLLLGVENQHKISVARAPTKEEMSLRAYTARCRLNRLRRAACRLFTSEKMVKAIKKLEIEIEARRLMVRKDRHLWKDVGERQKVLNWLLSYNPLWLRIGLETVYGELIPLEDNSDVTGLAVFILHRLLWNPDIAAEYRHPTVPHLYGDGHEEALSKFTLKKLLLLVCFLDYAKISRLIDHDPCLFCKNAEFKTSKEILLAFSRDFLSGEGDLSRHLGLLGLPVHHAQTPLDEFDFAVTNLAVDLQCGVRLVRALELLTQNWTLSKKLRMPAISRLQKMHNIDIVLNVLRSRGIPLNDECGNTILAKDIVDRHREKTLALLWKIAFAFQVEIALNTEQLKEEISFLRHTQSIKKAISALSGHPDVVDKKKEKRNSSYFDQYSENVKLLMDWVNAVCAFYNKKVENFTVSFSDGRVLCYLVHHYHPCYVPFDAICQRTTHTVDCAQTGSVVLNSSSESEGSSLDLSLKALDEENTSGLYKNLLENEKKNFQLVSSAVRNLGGIPSMIHHSDMSNTIPDEKVVITYLSFLCARLLDLRKETRAARLIQTAWRKYKLKTDRRRHQERDRAARIIQSAVIKFLTKQRWKRKVNAARTIQKCWRRHLAQRALLALKKEKLEKIQNKSALVIQRHWRSFSSRRQFLKLRYYSIILQSRIRMIIAANSYKRYLWAALTIQRRWRACLSRNRNQQRYEMLKASALIIQSAFRRWKQRKMQLEMRAATVLQRAFREWRTRKRAQEKAAVVIQSWYRMCRVWRRYGHIRSCVVLIQARFRGFQARKLYERKKAAVLTIQRRYRAYVTGKTARSQYLQKRAAVIQLQTSFRRMKARILHRRSRAACVLQSYWRMRRSRAQFLSLKKTVIKLQAHVRMRQQVQKYEKVKHAALVIQLHFRAFISARDALASYQKTRSATITLQSAFRGLQARQRFRHILTCITKIQASFRAHRCRKKFLSLKKATIKLQSVVRMQQTRKRYLNLRWSVLLIQRWYRATKLAVRQREEYVQLQTSCVKLQALVRGYLVRKQMRLQRKAATSLQSYFRMRKMRLRYLKIYKAALVIQNHYRAYKAQVLQRSNFLQLKRAVTCLQAAYRGYRVRQLIKHQSLAALKIQTAFRGYHKRVKYQCVRQSTIQIQRWYRARQTVREVRTQYLKVRAAVISLQAVYRGWRVRKQMRREREAAVKLQSAFRMAKAQKRYRLFRSAALVIQQHLRAWAVGKKQHREYIALRQAALVLQCTWRGVRTRRQIQEEHKCAVVIQAYYRMYVQRKKWKTMQRAARVIQVYYRTCHIGKKQRHLYLKTRAATVVLQSAYRSLRVRKNIKAWHRAAVTIQAGYRAYRTRKKYTAFRASAITIQRWYRNIKLADCQRKEYLNLKRAATQMQAVYRGSRVRRRVQHMHLAATVIQATFKMHRSKIRYQKLRTAAVVIQERYRAYCQGKTQRAKYLAILKAVGVLQAACRGARVRRTLRKEEAAATLIQTHYRRYRQQTQFNNLKRAARAVQQRYRAIRERNRFFQRYNTLRLSAIRIQAAYRGMRARRHLKGMHLAATLIQRSWRTHTARRRFLALREAAVWVQRKHRANVCARYHMQQFLRSRRAAIIIQASYRGWTVRKKLQEMSRAARLIQAAARMLAARARYRALRQASVVIQQRYRATRTAKLERHRYLQQRQSALTLQAAFRGMKTRSLVKTMHCSATLIQSRFRSSVMRKRFISLKKATVFIQRKYRATVCARHHRHQFLELRTAAIVLQSSYRRLRIKRVVQERHRAALLIQAAFRMHRAYVAFQTWKHASILIQRRYRAYRATKLQRENDIRQRHAAVVIQAAYKGMRTRQLLRHRQRAAVIIQSTYRMYRQYSYYRDVQWATEVIQKHYRANRKQKALQRNTLEKSACSQAGLQVGAPRQQIQTEHHAVTIIQKCFRAYRTRKHYLRLRAAAVFVQRRYRARTALRTQAALGMSPSRGLCSPAQCVHRAATLIQAFDRVHGARGTGRLFDDQAKGAAVVLQRHYESYVRLQMDGEQSLAAQKTVHTLQTAWRGHSALEKQENLPEEKVVATAGPSAVCHDGAETQAEADQSAALGTHQGNSDTSPVAHPGEAENHSRGTAAETAPEAFPGRDVALETRLGAEQRQRAAVTVQRYFRMWQARKRFLLYKKAAVVLQSHVRAFLSAKRQRNVYLQLRGCVIIIQAWTKGFLQKRKFQKMKADAVQAQILEQQAKMKLLRFTAAAFHHLSAFKIQRAFKLHLAVKNARKQIRSVICIQRWFRARLQEKRLIEKYRNIMEMERKAQALLLEQNRAAAVIQKCVRSFLLRKQQEKVNNGVRRFQALWRGYALRKNNCEKLKAIRLSLQVVNREIREEDKLYRRSALALHHLLTYKHLSAIIEALKQLDVVTRLSPLCCENMAQSGAISKIFVLIRSCNRSVPCMEVIKYAVQVLLNVAKYEKTTSAIYHAENCVDTLLDLLQMYREKPGSRAPESGGTIFTKTCCLLAVLLRATDRASDVRSRPKVVDRICSLYKLTVRKHKLNMERIHREQKNSSNIFFLPETPVRTKVVSRLKPYWVLRRDKVEEITNAFQAIQMVMDTLAIPYQ